MRDGPERAVCRRMCGAGAPADVPPERLSRSWDARAAPPRTFAGVALAPALLSSLAEDLMAQDDRTTTMHDAHTTWRADHAAWRDEASGWTTHYEATLASLARIETFVRDAAKAAAAHVETLEAHERALATHEHELARLEAACGSGHYAPGTVEHQSSSRQHRDEAEAHARQKATYHEVLALVRKLERAAGKPAG